jgi:hypothetical protein
MYMDKDKDMDMDFDIEMETDTDIQRFCCQISVKSLIRYPSNVRLCHLQSNLGDSNIMLSPISFFTDIGIRAHQCMSGTMK